VDARDDVAVRGFFMGAILARYERIDNVDEHYLQQKQQDEFVSQRFGLDEEHWG
jgi:hypothetical protein